MLMVAGLCSISRDSSAIGAGIVALKNSVCRRFGRWRKHAADVGQEAHVEHPVRFVEHEELEPGQLRVRRAEMIQQPARRGDDDVDAAAEGMFLRSHADAAEDRGARQRRVDRHVLEVFEDLRRQLARRREHQRARRAARLPDQLVQDGQQERGGLAAAGHRAGEQVLALERRRDGVGLDRRGFDETEVFEAFEQVGMELEVAERHGVL